MSKQFFPDYNLLAKVAKHTDGTSLHEITQEVSAYLLTIEAMNAGGGSNELRALRNGAESKLRAFVALKRSEESFARNLERSCCAES